MALAEMKEELAALEPDLDDVDGRIAEALERKEAAAAIVEEAKAELLALNAERDPIRLRVMELQRDIGIIEGIPTMQIGEGK
jgi:hypothetical protein